MVTERSRKVWILSTNCGANLDGKTRNRFLLSCFSAVLEVQPWWL